MSYYPEPGSYIRNRMKVELDLSNYATKQKIRICYRCWYISFSCQKDFISVKVEFDINKLINIPNSLINSKTKKDELDFGKLKTVFKYLKNLSDVVDKKVEKKMYNKLNTKAINLEKENPETTNLIHINHNKADKQNLEKQIEDVEIEDSWILMFWI